MIQFYNARLVHIFLSKHLEVSRNLRIENNWTSTNNASPFVVAAGSEAFEEATTYLFTSQSGFRGLGDDRR
jgi:hypothetical protein